MTLEKLKKIQPYITKYHIDVTQKDVDIVNKAIKMMSRKPRQLAAGDIVQFSDGVKISKHAIIEDVSRVQLGFLIMAKNTFQFRAVLFTTLTLMTWNMLEEKGISFLSGDHTELVQVVQ